MHVLAESNFSGLAETFHVNIQDLSFFANLAALGLRTALCT